MSVTTSPAPQGTAVEQFAATTAGSHQRKSYRRKYRKIMVKFEERMQESNGLFRDEQRIFDISQRLAEQTDQMLQLLLEFNNRPQVPSSLRFDLKPPTGTKPISKRDGPEDRQAVHESLRLARDQVQKGEITPFDYEQMQENVLKTPDFMPSKSYITLLRSSELSLSQASSSEPNSIPPAGTLSIRQEEQYLQSLDDYLDGKTSSARSHTSKNLGSRAMEKSTDRERETQLRNPVSVYNWLRRHQPQVFLQDHEATTSGDKASKSSASRSSKRTTGRDVKQEQEYYDEDGFAVDQGNSAKGKRKREEDTAFRPKGGRSGHSSKRRKEDGGGKRSKRSSLDARSL